MRTSLRHQSVPASPGYTRLPPKLFRWSNTLALSKPEITPDITR
jgi:hypothetical protein